MKLPLATLMTRPLAIVALLLAAGVIAFMLYFHSLEQQLPPDSKSIIQYEFAATPHTATDMFTTWQADGQAVIRWSLYIDFAFMPVYGLCLCGGHLAGGAGRSWPAADLGRVDA